MKFAWRGGHCRLAVTRSRERAPAQPARQLPAIIRGFAGRPVAKIENATLRNGKRNGARCVPRKGRGPEPVGDLAARRAGPSCRRSIVSPQPIRATSPCWPIRRTRAAGGDRPLLGQPLPHLRSGALPALASWRASGRWIAVHDRPRPPRQGDRAGAARRRLERRRAAQVDRASARPSGLAAPDHAFGQGPRRTRADNIRRSAGARLSSHLLRKLTRKA